MKCLSHTLLVSFQIAQIDFYECINRCNSNLFQNVAKLLYSHSEDSGVTSSQTISVLPHPLSGCCTGKSASMLHRNRMLFVVLSWLPC